MNNVPCLGPRLVRWTKHKQQTEVLNTVSTRTCQTHPKNWAVLITATFHLLWVSAQNPDWGKIFTVASTYYYYYVIKIFWCRRQHYVSATCIKILNFSIILFYSPISLWAHVMVFIKKFNWICIGKDFGVGPIAYGPHGQLFDRHTDFPYPCFVIDTSTHTHTLSVSPGMCSCGFAKRPWFLWKCCLAAVVFSITERWDPSYHKHISSSHHFPATPVHEIPNYI